MTARRITHTARAFVDSLIFRSIRTIRGPITRSVHTVRGPIIPPINATSRAQNFFTRPPKSLVITEVLVTAGALAFANEDVVSMGWKGVSFVEKNEGGAVLTAFRRKVMIKRNLGG
jgi:hypothetical protein